MKTKSHNAIVGQEQLLNEVSTIFDIFKNSECEIRPHFILTGPKYENSTRNNEICAVTFCKLSVNKNLLIIDIQLVT